MAGGVPSRHPKLARLVPLAAEMRSRLMAVSDTVDPKTADALTQFAPLAAAKGRDALTSKPQITISIGRTASWLLVAVAVLMLVEGGRSW
jgi:hypothetical protein